MLSDVGQLSLLPARRPCPPPDIEYIKALPTFRRVLRYAMSLADIEPKQVYSPMGKDKATWSRIESGDMSFPADDIERFCAIVGNDAVILWLNFRAGYDPARLPRLRDDKDRRIQELETALKEEITKNAIISEFVRATQVARR